jgi:hypothetical protein
MLHPSILQSAPAQIQLEGLMKQIAVTVAVGIGMLAIGLSMGRLAEVSQTLIFAGLIVLVVYGSAAAVFIVALYGTFKLWQIVLEALRGAKTDQAKALLQIIGGFDLSGSSKQAGSTRTVRATGTGLLGTFFIMGFACFVVYVMFSIVPLLIVKLGCRGFPTSVCCEKSRCGCRALSTARKVPAAISPGFGNFRQCRTFLSILNMERTLR